MSRRHRPFGHSYRDLIATVQETASDLADQQHKRDCDRLSYEKFKLALLLGIALTLWVMFGLLWGKLDSLSATDAMPAVKQPISIHDL